jgi:ABC-type dipeptide/oligopeptide/nickel transport system ATPase component
MQSHITTVFGHHSAPASSDNLELPAPIRIQVVPESKAGKSATIVKIENANTDTLQFAAFKSEIYNLTGLKLEEQRYQIIRDGKMTAMQALPAATANHISNTDEAIESILNNHIDIETEPETEPGVQPSLLDLGFVTLTEACYQLGALCQYPKLDRIYINIYMPCSTMT